MDVYFRHSTLSSLPVCVNGVNFTSLNIIERKHLINVGNGNSNFMKYEENIE